MWWLIQLGSSSQEKIYFIGKKSKCFFVPTYREDRWVFHELLRLTNGKTPVEVGDGSDD